MGLDFKGWRAVAIAVAMLPCTASGALTVDARNDIDFSRYPMGYEDPPPGSSAGLPQATVTRTYIPEAIDLSDHFPRPRKQLYGSCAAWAVGYAARSYYERVEKTVVSEEDLITSPSYIFNRIYNRKKDCKSSSSTIVDAITLLKDKGAASFAQFGVEQTCEEKSKYEVGVNTFRVKSFEVISEYPKRINIDVAKQTLASGHPVMIGLKVDKTFTTLRSTEIYNGVGNISEEDLLNMSGHAVTLVGYDERRRAFRLINSWDTTWGDGGFGWISDEALKRQTMHAYRMATFVNPPVPRVSRATSSPASIPLVVSTVMHDARCSDMQFTPAKEENNVIIKRRLTGFVSNAVDAAAIKVLNVIEDFENEVELKPWPLCEAMLTLREPLRAASKPEITLTGGDRPLKVGETFSFTVKPPNVPSFLYVFYIEDDGTVVNLAPRTGPIRKQTDPAAPPLVFGDGRDRRPTFRVTPLKTADTRPKDERGHEAVIAIASRSPIEELETLETSDNKIYREPAKAGKDDGPPDRLLLTKLKDIVHQRAEPDMLPREVSAAILHVRIQE